MKENNKWKYQGDSRYEKVWANMRLLGIQDVTTDRQHKNGTIVWKLPIRMTYKNGKFIEVASFKTGYIRNQNCCHSNYQLNKCKPNVEYFPEYKWIYDENGQPDHQIKTGKYRKYVGKSRILIPLEIDRLEYLISYCLKNYYITYANQVANGDFVTKWKHKWELERVKKQFYGAKNVSVNIDGIRYKVI